MKAFLILFCIFTCNIANAYSQFYSDRVRGWFWYEEKAPEEEIEQQSKSANNVSALEELQQFQRALEEKKAAMIMRPSAEAARDYIAYQNEMYNKADQVSKYWKVAMLSDPELNIVKDIPVSDVGAKLHRAKDEQVEQRLLKEFAKKFKLLFFYKKSCQYCTGFADVLEVFSHRYGYRVAAVTLDGGTIDKFPASGDQALATKLNVKYTPSLFAFSEELGIAVPVSHGFMSIDMLEQNMIFVATQVEAKL